MIPQEVPPRFQTLYNASGATEIWKWPQVLFGCLLAFHLAETKYHAEAKSLLRLDIFRHCIVILKSLSEALDLA